MNKEEIKIDGIPIEDYNGFTSKTIYNDEICKSETPIVKPAIYNEYIPKQKIKDKLEKLKEQFKDYDEKWTRTLRDKKHPFYRYMIRIEAEIDILEELLEGDKK